MFGRKENPVLELVRRIVAIVLLFAVSLSLVGPYNSDFYSHDGFAVKAPSGYPEKVEVGTNIQASPAEATEVKPIQLLRSSYSDLKKCSAEMADTPWAVIRQSAGIKPLRLFVPMLHSRPSKVVALRRLLI